MCEIPESAPHLIPENNNLHRVATSPVQHGCTAVASMPWQAANASARRSCSPRQMNISREATGTIGPVRPMASLVTHTMCSSSGPGGGSAVVRTACNTGQGAFVGSASVPLSPVVMSQVGTALHGFGKVPSPKRERCSLNNEPLRSRHLRLGQYPGSCGGTDICGIIGGVQACRGSQVGIKAMGSSCYPVVRYISEGASKGSHGSGGDKSSASNSSLQRVQWGGLGGSVHVYTRTDLCTRSGRLVYETPRMCKGSSGSVMVVCDDRMEACCIPGSNASTRHESDGVSAESDDAPGTREGSVVALQADAVRCEASHCQGPPAPEGDTAASDRANAVENSTAAAASRAVAHGSRLRGASGGMVRQGGASTINNISKSHKSMRPRTSSCSEETADAISGSNTGGECSSPRDALPGKMQASPLRHGTRGPSSGGSIDTAAAGNSGGTPGNNRSRGSRFRSSVGGGGSNNTPPATPSPAQQSRGGQLATSGNKLHTAACNQSTRDGPDSPTAPEIQISGNTPSSRTRNTPMCWQSARSNSVPQRLRLEQRPLAAATADVSRQGVGPLSSQSKQLLHARAPSAPPPRQSHHSPGASLRTVSPPSTRQSHHSPGVCHRSTLSASRQNSRPADPSNKCKTMLLSFLRGTGIDAHGRRFEDIMEWDFRRLERSHDYIQWIFPTDEPSRFNVRAPVLTPDLVISIRKDPAVVASIRRAFGKFCAFLGFELVVPNTKIQDAEQPRMLVRQAPHFHERFNDCWEVGFTGIGFNHNWLRISRVLHCLRLVGLQEEAAAFLACLEQMPELGIRCGGALVHWRKRACTEVEVATPGDTDWD